MVRLCPIKRHNYLSKTGDIGLQIHAHIDAAKSNALSTHRLLVVVVVVVVVVVYDNQ